MPAEREAHSCVDIGNDDEGWVFIECECGARFDGLPDFCTAVDELLDHVAGGQRVVVFRGPPDAG